MPAKGTASLRAEVPLLFCENMGYASGSARPHPDNGTGDPTQRPQQPSPPYKADVSASSHYGAAADEEEDAVHLGDFNDAYRGLTTKAAADVGQDSVAMLWTMDEEAVLQNSSETSLERIRGRLTVLLLGVSDALRTRKALNAAKARAPALVAPPQVPKTAGHAVDEQRMDFTEQLRAADHAVRRLLGEAFETFAEGEVAQMAQLCSLADGGSTDCDELVHNAVVVLQALTHDGDAVRDVAHFRRFLHANGAEISSPQWQHDFATAMRSLAVGFLRRPEAVMASHGASVTQVVEHEELYTALLRVCAGRSMGSGLSLASTAAHADPAAPVMRKPSTASLLTSPVHVRVPRQHTRRQSRQHSMYMHSPPDCTGNMLLRCPSLMMPEPFMPCELPQCMLTSTASTPTRRGNGASRSRRVSAMARSRHSLVQAHEGKLGESLSVTAPSGKKQQSPGPQHSSGTAAEHSPSKKSAAERRKPMPEVPQRLSVRRGVGAALAHY